MNKRLIIISLITMISALFANQAMALVPLVDARGAPASASCKTATVTATGQPSLIQPILHFDKIIFMIAPTAQLVAVQPGEQPLLDKIPHNTELDIKVIDNPRTVADLKGKVLSFLGAVPSLDSYQSIRIVNVEYAVVVCPR